MLKREAARLINVNPIQRGGILPKEVREQVAEWTNGYSVCDFCEGDLHGIEKPPLRSFVEELKEFLSVEELRLTLGAREGKFIVMHSLCKPGDSVLVDANAHYTTHLAAERVGVRVYEVPSSGHPSYEVREEAYAEWIERVEEETGSPPKLALLTWPDGSYGNLPDARKVAKVCHEYEVPLLLNAAYSVGRMRVNAKKLGVDFLVASGHKSMASSGPIGLLAMSEENAALVFRKSERWGGKEVELLGCGPRGLAAVTLYLSFPHVKERVERWEEELRKTHYLVDRLEALGFEQLGEKPKRHDLVCFEAKPLHEISKLHKRGKYFLYHELKRRGIVGIKPGLTRRFKLSVYQLNVEEVKRVVEAFEEIVSYDH